MPERTWERSFDELAKGLAGGTVSRRKALRMLGAALVGGVLASVPGVALAKPKPGKCNKDKHCPSGQRCVGGQCGERPPDVLCQTVGGEPLVCPPGSQCCPEGGCVDPSVPGFICCPASPSGTCFPGQQCCPTLAHLFRACIPSGETCPACPPPQVLLTPVDGGEPFCACGQTCRASCSACDPGDICVQGGICADNPPGSGVTTTCATPC